MMPHAWRGANLLAPVMPNKMRQLRLLFGCLDGDGWAIPWGRSVPPGNEVREGILFPKRTQHFFDETP